MSNIPRALQVVAIAITAVAVLFIAGYYYETGKNPTKNLSQKNQKGGSMDYIQTPHETVALLEAKPLTDTDGDGLLDWEEILWGTRIDKADTDGDGTDDKTEISLGRNPLKKGPNDIMQNQTTSTSSVQTNTQKLTATDKLGREIFSEYMSLRNYGLANDPDFRSQAAIKALELSIEDRPTATIYTTRNFKTVPDSPENITSYKIIFENLLKQTLVVGGRDEAAITKDSLDNQDPNILKELDPIIANYQVVLKTLLNMDVPQSVIIEHMKFTNGVSRLIFMDIQLTQIFVDPLISLQALADYHNIFRDLAISLVGIRSKISVTIAKENR